MKDAEKKLADSMNVEFEICEVDIDGFKLNYLISGRGPNLLLLHGANIGWGMWYKNIPAFAKHFKIIALDLPFSGHSGREGIFWEDFEQKTLSIVDKFLKQVGFSPSFIIGHSFGGWLAAKLSGFGWKPNKIVLVDSLGFSDDLPMQYRLIEYKKIKNILQKTIFKPTLKKMANFLKSVLSKEAELDNNFINYYHSAILYGGLSHPLEFMRALINRNKLGRSLMLTNSEIELLPKTMFIHGRYDPIISLSDLESRLLNIENKEISVVHSGHVPPLEQPQVFNHLVKSFFLV